MTRSEQMPRPKLTRRWKAGPDDARELAKGIAMDALTRRGVIVFTVMVLALTVLVAVLLRQWWWPVVGLVYLVLLDAMVYWSRLRALGRIYRPGVRFAVGINSTGFCVSQNGSDGLFRYSSVARVEPKGSVVFMKIVRGRRVAWPRELFGDELLAEIQTRVTNR